MDIETRRYFATIPPGSKITLVFGEEPPLPAWVKPITKEAAKAVLDKVLASIAQMKDEPPYIVWDTLAVLPKGAPHETSHPLPAARRLRDTTGNHDRD